MIILHKDQSILWVLFLHLKHYEQTCSLDRGNKLDTFYNLCKEEVKEKTPYDGTSLEIKKKRLNKSKMNVEKCIICEWCLLLVTRVNDLSERLLHVRVTLGISILNNSFRVT